jgi:hypothetical protein
MRRKTHETTMLNPARERAVLDPPVPANEAPTEQLKLAVYAICPVCDFVMPVNSARDGLWCVNSNCSNRGVEYELPRIPVKRKSKS